MSERKEPPISDPEQGVWRGRRIARRVVSDEGFTILVGKSAEDNDDLSLRLAVAMPPAWHFYHPCEQCGFADDGPREWCA